MRYKNNFYKSLLIPVLVLLLSSCGVRERHTLRIVSYNVGVFHKADTNTIGMVAEMMKEVNTDVLSLNELDSCTIRTGHEYQLDLLAKALGGWNYKYAANIDYQGGKYGVGIAAKPSYEILDFHKIFLPREESEEQRGLAVAEFKDFVFATTHLDYTSKSDQLKQAQKATAWLKEHYGDCGKPVFLSGDMNAVPESETMAEFKKDWTVLSAFEPTIPSHKPRECIDYIMVLNGTAECTVVEAHTLTEFESGDIAIASDHAPVMAVVEW